MPTPAELLRVANSTTEVEYAIRQLMQMYPRDKYESDVMYFARLFEKVTTLT
jgi:hypothetical protein